MIWNICFFFVLQFYRFLSFLFKFIVHPKPKKKTVLYLAAFFPENAGYHWRVKKWAEVLQNEGYSVDVLHVFSKKELDQYEDNSSLFLMKIVHRRFWQVLRAQQFETIIVRRELLLFNPYGGHFLEKLLRRCSNFLILDFDDDLAAAKNEPKVVTSLFGKWMQEDGNSFRNSFQYYDGFMVASSYLKEYVLQYAMVDESNIIVIPTCVDYDKYPSKIYHKQTTTLTFGWIGSPNNYYHLNRILPILSQLAEKYTFKLLVISDGSFNTETTFPIVNKVWSLETEVNDLNEIDVGLMPLDTSTEAKGKGGFKLIQYMGLGIVSLASAITINNDIISQEVDSFLIYTDSEWREILDKVLSKQIDLEKIGSFARHKIVNNYTYSSNREAYIRFIENN